MKSTRMIATTRTVERAADGLRNSDPTERDDDRSSVPPYYSIGWIACSLPPRPRGRPHCRWALSLGAIIVKTVRPNTTDPISAADLAAEDRTIMVRFVCCWWWGGAAPLAWTASSRDRRFPGIAMVTGMIENRNYSVSVHIGSLMIQYDGKRRILLLAHVLVANRNPLRRDMP